MLMAFNPAINGWAIFSEACRRAPAPERGFTVPNESSLNISNNSPLWTVKRAEAHAP
jgi:hypothetical protein